jgi:hypothetical protein
MSAPPKTSKIAEMSAAVGLFVTSRAGDEEDLGFGLDFFGCHEGVSLVSKEAS